MIGSCQIKYNKKQCFSILYGQILSIFICGTAVSSAYFSKVGVYIPVTQGFLNYLLIAFTYGLLFAFKSAGNLHKIVKNRGYLYLIASIIDVEANYIIVKAYQYTNVTSVQLLDCLAIPTVFILNIFVFKVRYLFSHIIGVILCIIGAVGMVLIDYYTNKSQGQDNNPLLGDCLVIIGAICYGISNVLQEYLVRKHNRIEYLGFLGVFSSIISGCQIMILERQVAPFIDNFHNELFWISLVGFMLSMYLLYSLMPHMMRISSAVFTNLSLLTADLYALIIGIFLFNNSFHWLYFLAYSSIMIGVAIYVVREPLKREDNENGCIVPFWKSNETDIEMNKT